MIFNDSSGSETTYSIGDQLEKVITASGIDYRHYIEANGERIAILSRNDAGTNTTPYVLEDNQGGIENLVDASGNAIVNESFSAFGNRRNAAIWSGAPSLTDLTTMKGITRSGYTGQTVLGNMGLNHRTAECRTRSPAGSYRPIPTSLTPATRRTTTATHTCTTTR